MTTMAMKKGITSGGLFLVCAVVVAFASVTEAGKLSPATCMPECMEICPKDATKNCQAHCTELCDMMKAFHEEGMSGKAGGQEQKHHQGHHAKTAHPGKPTDGKKVDEDGSASLAICKSSCMPTCNAVKVKKPLINCDKECEVYCLHTIDFLNFEEEHAKSKSKH